MAKSLPEWTTLLILGGLVLVAFAIMNRRNPEKVNNVWRAITVSLTLGALWFWQERLNSFSQSLGYGWLFTFGLVVLVVFALWGIVTRKPA